MSVCLSHHVRTVLERADCPAQANFKTIALNDFNTGMYVRLQRDCVDELYWDDIIENRIGDFESCDSKLCNV